MKHVTILEDNDLVDGNDWCRPLWLTYSDFGDCIHTKSCYGGFPENNMQWVKVKHVLGIWEGKTVREIHKQLKSCPKYEFLRGDLPTEHILPMKGYTSL